jgi:hypothetical protein
MRRAQVQAHSLQTGSYFPHCRHVYISRLAGPTQRANVDGHGLRTRKTAWDADKWGSSCLTGPRTFIAHRPGTILTSVDGVWTAMYESNQRSNNYYKKIQDLDL